MNPAISQGPSSQFPLYGLSLPVALAQMEALPHQPLSSPSFYPSSLSFPYQDSTPASERLYNMKESTHSSSLPLLGTPPLHNLHVFNRELYDERSLDCGTSLLLLIL